VLDDGGWIDIKTVPTTVGSCQLRKKQCTEKGKPDYYAGTTCILEGVTIDKFLETVVGMPEGVKKWDQTLVDVRTIEKITEQDMIYQSIYDPGKIRK